MIEVDKLRRLFGNVVALDDLSFAVKPGEIFGLLGPNGAGKTTCIGCITGLLKPASGRVTVMGHDMARDGRRARQALGVVPQDLAIYTDLTAEENLRYWGGAQRLGGALLRERVAEALELMGLADRAREPVARFSGGMKRRLNFACAIVHHPQVLLLDEPTVGIDPQSRVRLLELVRKLAREGACILYTTHYMEEAEALCDRVAIADGGRVVAQGTLPELRAMLGERDVLRLTGTFDTVAARAALAGQGVEVLQAETGVLTLAIGGAFERLPAVFALLAAAGAVIRSTTVTQPSLESLFLKLTGKELRE